MKPLEVAGTIILLSGVSAWFLFNYAGGLLGPYGQSNDVYHELILAGMIFLGTTFILIARKVGAFSLG